ncbi:MAG: phosphoadenosine phosphosulfate reductase family protein, partial [Nannocystaceae bacterium]|nr:phosphoadenosine phosphosulfate reductase family protein [Nannocystaceae bacterium]
MRRLTLLALAFGPGCLAPAARAAPAIGHDGESVRVFPISNWTEMDIWSYIRDEGIPI